MDKRYIYNKFILNKLSELVEKYPELRLGQLLVNSGIVETTSELGELGVITLLIKDPYFEEPDATWERIQSNRFAFPPEL